KIQTEAVTILQERGLLEKIKEHMERVSLANLEYQKKTGIESRVKGIAESIGKRTAEAEKAHATLLETVEEADKAHAIIRELEPLIGPAQRRAEWLGHRVQFHKESAAYWEDRAKREPTRGKKKAKGGGGHG
ncbi:MAG: hypothetical protein KAT70_07270, partial [Thermoplasmata archaeon]|nr:hypothetical protein [Thermoplasmata archaeon]